MSERLVAFSLGGAKDTERKVTNRTADILVIGHFT